MTLTLVITLLALCHIVTSQLQIITLPVYDMAVGSDSVFFLNGMFAERSGWCPDLSTAAGVGNRMLAVSEAVADTTESCRQACIDRANLCYAYRYQSDGASGERCWSYTTHACQALRFATNCDFYLRVGCISCRRASGGWIAPQGATENCILPFTFNGNIYQDCSSVNINFPDTWCPTNTANVKFRTGYEWGICWPVTENLCPVTTTPSTTTTTTTTTTTPTTTTRTTIPTTTRTTTPTTTIPTTTTTTTPTTTTATTPTTARTTTPTTTTTATTPTTTRTTTPTTTTTTTTTPTTTRTTTPITMTITTTPTTTTTTTPTTTTTTTTRPKTTTLTETSVTAAKVITVRSATTTISASTATRANNATENVAESTAQSNDKLGLVIGVTTGFVVLCIIVLLVVIMCRYKRRKSTCNDIHNFHITDQNNPVQVQHLVEYIKSEKNKNRYNSFEQEYKSLISNQTTSVSFASQDVLKDGHNIVILKNIRGDQTTSYKNASLLPNYYRQKAFIATIGPDSATCCDFWRMVWKHHCKCIIMLTNLVENMTEICARYWPEINEPVSYGKIQVTTIKTKRCLDYEVNTILLSKGNVQREVQHVIYTGWPNQGVPQNAVGLLRARKRMQRYQGAASVPIVVHCSDGTGRTGTFVAIDFLLDQGMDLNYVDVYKHVSTLRTYTDKIVRTADQYCFIYDVLSEGLLFGITCVPCSNFITNAASLDDGKGNTEITKEFEFLHRMDTLIIANEFEEAQLEDNTSKKGNKTVLSVEAKQKNLKQQQNGRFLSLNPVHVNSYTTGSAFIATRLPLENALEEFWAFIVAEQCRTVVWIKNTTDDISWAPNSTNHMASGANVIRVSKEAKVEDGVFSQQIRIESMDGTEESVYMNDKVIKEINVFSASQNAMFEPSILLKLVKQVRAGRLNNEGRTVVMCMNDDAGIYIAAEHIVEMAELDGEIDIFQIVKELKTTRQTFIHTLKEYNYLHRFVRVFVELSRLNSGIEDEHLYQSLVFECQN